MSPVSRKRLWPYARRAIGIVQMSGWDPISGLRIHGRDGWQRLGSPACGWFSPLLPADAVCYCVGVGEDASFDLELISRFGAEVHAFDPTPRAQAYAEKHASGTDKFTLHPWAIWGANETVRLYEPANASHVSHSIVNLQDTTGYFEAPGRTIDSVMTELGHHSIDLVKMDIEGAEYFAIAAILAANVDIQVLNIEFDELSINRPGFRGRIRSSALSLVDAGYELVMIDNVSNYHFRRSTPGSRLQASAEHG